MFIVLNLLFGSDPVNAIVALGGVLTLDADRVVGDVSCKTLSFHQEKGPGLRLLVDPESKLLRAIDLVYDPKDLFENKPGQDEISIDRLGWLAGPIATGDIPAKTFAFEPPGGFTKVESVAQAAGLSDKSPVEGLVGKPAPDFTLSVFDGPGKIKTLSKADLAGKVVLIDFWATWCEPCLMELPEIQKLVEVLARDKKNVLIIALSQDDEPSEIGELRKRIEKTLAENKITLTGTPVGLVGFDPSHSAHNAFHVDGLPTTVLIDAKGVVQAAHIGIPRGDVAEVGRMLRKEIDTLLEGKPLTPAPEEAAATGKPEPAR